MCQPTSVDNHTPQGKISPHPQAMEHSPTEQKQRGADDDDNNRDRGVQEKKLAEAQEGLRLGTLYGSVSLALICASFTLTIPHMQSRRDSLGCDSLCLGSMTSARSALSLVGSAVIGRLSDSDPSSPFAAMLGGGSGRRACLYFGVAGTAIGLIVAGNTDSLRGMWLSMIPGALFQQNFSVLKAMLSDYHEAIEVASASASSSKDSTDGTGEKEGSAQASHRLASDRAGSVGKLGMAAGLAFMVGPITGAMIVKSYGGAVQLATVLTLLSAAFVSKLPDVQREKGFYLKKESSEGKIVSRSISGVLLSFLDVKAARSPAALFIMSMRICMAMAFHIYHTIWTVSLKERFNFGPSDHGKFMSFIGLTYALSQGFVAKRILTAFGKTGQGRVRLIQICCLGLGAGRYVAFQVSSLPTVYLMFAAVISCLGVLNTVLTADTSILASSKEIGGLFGVLAAVESVAGMVGPILGGMLAMVDPVKAPLLAVVGLYFFVFCLTTFGYQKYILRKQSENVPKDQKNTSNGGGKKLI